jgi:hypothetical protein
MWEDNHVYSDFHNVKLRSVCAKYEGLAKRFPDVRFYLSPFCEHKLNNPDKYLDIVKQYAPSCIPVNTPIPNGGSFSYKYLNEIHKSDRRKPDGRYLFSYDGVACVDSNVEQDKLDHSNADIFFFWDAQFNGNHETNSPHVSIPDRTDYATNQLIDSIIFLKNQTGKAKLPKGWIYKSHSENKGTGDPRANKPVLLSPKSLKFSAVQLVADNGQVVATLSRYVKPNSDGRWRYYSSSWGYEIALKAMRIQKGNPLVRVVVNNRTYGIINPGFRLNEFR